MKGPWFAVTTMPTLPEMYWIVGDGTDFWSVYNAAAVVVTNLLPGAIGFNGYPQRQYMLGKLIICTQATVTNKVTKAQLAAYLGS